MHGVATLRHCLGRQLSVGLVTLAGALALAACGGGATGTATPFSLGGGSRIQGFTPTPTAATEAVTPGAPPPTSEARPTAPPPNGAPRPPIGGSELQIESVGNQNLFDKDSLVIKAGSQVTVAFANKANIAAIQHNWVLVRAGTEDSVATAGLAAGPGSDWVPKDDPNVIDYVRLLDGGDSDKVTFNAPPSGTYAFICTFPGHNITMFGIFEVSE